MPRNSRCCRIRFDRLILFFLRDHSFPSRTVLAMTKRARALAYDIARRDSFDVSCSTTRDYFTFETTSAMLGRTTSTLPLLLLHRHSKRYHWSSIASRTLKIFSIRVKINFRSLSLSLFNLIKMKEKDEEKKVSLVRDLRSICQALDLLSWFR